MSSVDPVLAAAMTEAKEYRSAYFRECERLVLSEHEVDSLRAALASEQEGRRVAVEERDAEIERLRSVLERCTPRAPTEADHHAAWDAYRALSAERREALVSPAPAILASLRAKVAAMEETITAMAGLFDKWDLKCKMRNGRVILSEREEWYGEWKRAEDVLAAYRASQPAPAKEPADG